MNEYRSGDEYIRVPRGQETSTFEYIQVQINEELSL